MQKGASFFCWGIIFLVLILPKSALSASGYQVRVTATVMESITYLNDGWSVKIQTNIPAGYWMVKKNNQIVIVARF